jgi:hypothetical protein
MKVHRVVTVTLTSMLLGSLLSLSARAQASAGGQSASPATVAASNAKQTESKGELLLKRVYSTLSRYNNAGNKFAARTKGVEYLPAYDLRFDLQNVRTGFLEEIIDRPIGELVSKPEGRMVEIAPHVRQVGKDPQYVMYAAKWSMGHFSSNIREDWEHTTLGEALRLTNNQAGKHYVAYEVLVTLGGTQRAYKALAIFADLNQSAVTPKVLFFDSIVGQTILNKALNEYRPLLRANWEEYVGSREYQNYRRAFEQAGGDYARANAAMRTSMAKNSSGTVTTAQLASSDDPVAPSMPIEPCEVDCGGGDTGGGGGGGGSVDEHTYGTPQTRERVGEEKHCWGTHKAQSTHTGHCTYSYRTAGNLTTCKVGIANSGVTDSGFVSGSCHQTGQEFKYVDGQGPMSGTVDCSSTYVAAVKECLFCACSVSITVSGVGSGQSDGFWTFENGLSFTCAAR